jgi:DNA-directed RNA polymerase subunit M/transcription elongation factor TFIIS
VTALSAAKIRHLTALRDLTDNDHPLSRGVPGQAIARKLWPDSPGWERRTRRHGTNHPGQLGGTMPMKGARAARELADLGLVIVQYTDYHQALFKISDNGRKLLIELGVTAPAAKPEPRDCPNCGEPDMFFHPGDAGESDLFECPDCGHEEAVEPASKEHPHPYSGNRSQDTCWVGAPKICAKPIDDPIHVGEPSYPGTSA